MTRYTAVLDACALVPIALADTLLRLAERGLYRPLWSERIFAEAASAIAQLHPDLSDTRVLQRFQDMSHAFEDAEVTGWEPLEEAVQLPDPDDRHVVAVALKGRGDVIVTANLRDYPADSLQSLGIEVAHPDDFLLDQLDLASGVVLQMLR